MKNIIFYFTGTGNSLLVARDISNNIGDTRIESITQAIKERNIDLSYDRIGFVFPVYYSLMPKIVKRFIEKLSFNKEQYIFSVITLGGILEMAQSELSSCVEERGGVLNAAFKVNMPGNYIASYGAFPKIVQGFILKKEKKKTKYISNVVNEKGVTPISKGDILSLHTSKKLHKIVEEDFNMRAQNFNTNNKCTGCKVCEKVCSVSNIRVTNYKPEWGNSCEHCMACIQWCPAKAIEYSNKTMKRVRYHNPEVKITDLI